MPDAWIGRQNKVLPGCNRRSFAMRKADGDGVELDEMEDSITVSGLTESLCNHGSKYLRLVSRACMTIELITAAVRYG